MPFKIGQIGDVDNGIGKTRVGRIAQNIQHHALVLRVRIEAVRAGQVNNSDIRPAVGQGQSANFFINGDAREIADFLPQPRQLIENGGFSCVWIAHEGESERFM